MIETFAITLVGVAAAQASPGPNLVAVASAALAQGRRAGLVVTSGVATGMLIWALAVSFGLGALFTAYPVSLLALKLAGGLYLLWLGLKGLRAAWIGRAASLGAADRRRSDLQNWRRGLFVILTNPKAALMWAAVATFLFGQGLATWQVAAFGPVGALSGFAIYGSYALLFSTGTAGRFFRRFARATEAVFGAAFGLFGASLIRDGVSTLRH